MTEININNLTKLINHLKLVNSKNFNMSDWFDTDYSSASEIDWEEQTANELVQYMEEGKGDCGTAGCIAGHASLLSSSEAGHYVNEVSSTSGAVAAEWLGLTYTQSNNLFMPWSYDWKMLLDVSSRDITLAWAIAVLEHLKATALEGRAEVDWRVGKPESVELNA